MHTSIDKMLLTAMQGIALLVLIVLLPYYLMFMSERARLVSALPGPTPLPFIGNLLDVGLNGIDFIRIMVALREKYGSIVRMWFGPYLVVAVGDPRHAEIFLASKTNIKKSLHYRFMEPLVGKGILTSAGDKWRSDRKLINPAFHYTLLEGFASVFNSQASILTQKLKKEVGGSEFPINKYLTRCSLDIACETSMGVRMNIQDNENNEYLQAISGVEPIVIKRMLRPWLYPDFLFRLTGLWKRQNALIKAMLGTSEKIIQRKKREFLVKEKESENDVNENGIGHKQRSPFLNLLLQNEKDGHLTDQDIRDQVNTFLAAGHDTVAVSVGFCLWLLANHPQYQERAYEELNSIFGDSDREATTEDVHNMKYLETVLKETMRLYPPVPICLRELEEEVKFDGCQLLPGTTILLSVYLIHRHPDYYPEPEKFDPDRFSPERAKGRHPFAFVPFSAGPRNCIGQKFAMIAMKTIISKILRTYKLLPGTTKPVFTIDIALKSCTGFHIKLEDRR